MNSQEFLILNVVCATLFVAWYWRGRQAGVKKPTPLNMHAPDRGPLIIPPEKQAEVNSVAAFSRSMARGGAAPAMAPAAKTLNVIFNYNGHSWDAYEVLGIPAGSQLRDVTAAYQLALRNTDPASHPFLETAYKAIMHRF